MPLPLGIAAADLAMGALGIGGSMLTNAANRREAERNRRFQERMSSTAAQRGVEDYRKAGLNPALAYERGASSPGGSTATLSDPVAAGVSSALQARVAREQIKLVQAQERKTRIESEGATQDALFKLNTLEERQLTEIAQQRFLRSLMPLDFSIREMDAKQRRYQLPESFGEKYVDRAKSILGLLDRSGIPMLKSGRGPEMKFEAALPSATREPSPFTMRRPRP